MGALDFMKAPIARRPFDYEAFKAGAVAEYEGTEYRYVAELNGGRFVAKYVWRGEEKVDTWYIDQDRMRLRWTMKPTRRTWHFASYVPSGPAPAGCKFKRCNTPMYERPEDIEVPMWSLAETIQYHVIEIEE